MMLLRINQLKVDYFIDGQEKLKAVDVLELKIPESSIFAIVGESGCGKTTLGLSITGLINPKEGIISSGSVVFDGINLLRLSNEGLRDIRGKKISYIFQEPATSLNPVLTIGEQIEEVLIAHGLVPKAGAKEPALTALKDARLDDPRRIYYSYPHQLSGGMKQRAMIAMAISTNPKLLIADEPTTALDVDTESGILDLLLRLRDELMLSVVFITHDIRIVERIADYAAVMHNAKIVEVGEKAKVLKNPRHEYTRMLLESLPEKLNL
jgi:peptide/nickel transport system ATP-binding protein